MICRFRLTLAILLVLWLLGASVQANAAAELPDYEGWVNDYAGILQPDEKANLETLLSDLEKATGAEMTVVIVNTTSPLEPKMYVVRLMEKWKVGKAEIDNGVILLVSMQERRVEVEVGYGLEHVLTDSTVGRILDADLVPAFREDRYADGILKAVGSIESRIRASTDGSGVSVPPEQTAPSRSKEVIGLAIAMVFFGVLVVLVALRSGLGRKCPKCKTRLRATDRVVTPATAATAGVAIRRYSCAKCGYYDESRYRIPPIMPVRRYPGGGGFGGIGGGRSGGGFGGFGGGRSGGGGAGRSW